MNLFHIVVKSLRQHALSTWVTAVSIALAGGLLMSVWSVKTQSNQAFTNVSGGFDAVLGARGSKLQLVLNSIYHLEASPGNMKWQDFLDIQSNRSVAEAIPLAVGDNFHGTELLVKLYVRQKPLHATIDAARHLKFSEPRSCHSPCEDSIIRKRLEINRVLEFACCP